MLQATATAWPGLQECSAGLGMQQQPTLFDLAGPASALPEPAQTVFLLEAYIGPQQPEAEQNLGNIFY